MKNPSSHVLAIVLFGVAFQMPAIMHAQGSPKPVTVQFQNRVNVPVDYFWKPDGGQPRRYGTILPGATITQETYYGHKWIFMAQNIKIGDFTPKKGEKLSYSIKDKRNKLANAGNNTRTSQPVVTQTTRDPRNQVNTTGVNSRDPRNQGFNSQITTRTQISDPRGNPGFTRTVPPPATSLNTSRVITTPPAAGGSSSAATEMLQLFNQQRARAGAEPLKLNALLNSAADGHSDWMRTTNTLSHTGRNNSQFHERMSATGHTFRVAAENVATGSRADDVLDRWMNSQAHRANILNPDHHKVGISQSGDYWTAVFSD